MPTACWPRAGRELNHVLRRRAVCCCCAAAVLNVLTVQAKGTILESGTQVSVYFSDGTGQLMGTIRGDPTGEDAHRPVYEGEKVCARERVYASEREKERERERARETERDRDRQREREAERERGGG